MTNNLNKHIEHIEDNIFNYGILGAVKTVGILDELLTLSSFRNSIKISRKFDGAPSIIVGRHPENHKLFVATKRLFNKTPIFYTSEQEIDDDDRPDGLAEKLKLVLKYFKHSNIEGIIQGDFLYSSKSIDKKRIKGVNYITFHPNTLIYAVPEKSDLAKDILKSKIGIIWHTSYEGQSLKNLCITNKRINVNKLNTPDVWNITANINSRDISFSRSEIKHMRSHLNKAKKVLSTIDVPTLKKFSKKANTFKKYHNLNVKNGGKITNPRQYATGYVKYLDKIDFTAPKLNGESQDNSIVSTFSKIKKHLSNKEFNNLTKIYEFQAYIIMIKEYIIKTLDNKSEFKTFISTDKDQYIATNHEGIVVSDDFRNDLIKLVDRYEFARNNFNPEIKKGWSR